jgi:enoyl-CoA hydratase/carnithine racemase
VTVSRLRGSDVLDVEQDGGTLVARLNRPGKLNALDAELLDDLRGLWAAVAESEDIRCVIVTGAGAGFCAGADLGLLSSDREATTGDVDEELAFLPGRRLDVPVICAVNGVCAGGGLHFVADADIALASRAATFLDPHVTVGHVSALEPLELSLRMRPDAVRRMVLLGSAERLDAERAQEVGLVSEVVPAASLMPRALELAAAIASGSPVAVASSRRVLRDFESALLDRHLEAGWAAIRRHWRHPDALEGPRAAGDGRAPEWSGGST